MSRKDYVFTSESVSEGHPDKVCDRISDAILDAFLKVEPNARVACETFATTNRVVVGGEVGLSDQDKLKSMMDGVDQIVRDCVRDIGYEQDEFHWKTLKLKKKVTFSVGVPQDAVALDTLDFKSFGIANDNVIAWLEVKQRTWWGMGLTPVGFGDVENGQTTMSVRVPGWVKPQKATLVLKAHDSGTTVRIPVTIKKK